MQPVQYSKRRGGRGSPALTSAAVRRYTLLEVLPVWVVGWLNFSVPCFKDGNPEGELQPGSSAFRSAAVISRVWAPTLVAESTPAALAANALPARGVPPSTA